jgi:hypothetical protein
MTLEAARTPLVVAGFSATDTWKEQIVGGQLGTSDGRGWGEVEYGRTTPTMETGGCTYAIVDVVLWCFYSSRRWGRTRLDWWRNDVSPVGNCRRGCRRGRVGEQQREIRPAVAEIVGRGSVDQNPEDKKGKERWEEED